MANNKKIKLTVDTDVKDKDVQDLHKLVKKLNDEKIVIQPDTTKAINKLDEVLRKKQEMKESGEWDLGIRVDPISKEINKLKTELGMVDDEPIEPKFDDSAVQLGISNIMAGFQQLKAGAMEFKDVFSDVLEGAGQRESTSLFLQHTFDGDINKAEQVQSTIQDIIAELPGDDKKIQSILTGVIATDITVADDKDLMNQIAEIYADYENAMLVNGKSVAEAEQDIRGYLMSGDTAELQKSPILKPYIDQLKEAKTVKERTALVDKFMTETHYRGLATQESYNKTLGEWEGMTQRGADNLGAMFLGGTKGAMDFLIDLDKATGGIIGMGMAAAGFATPAFEMAQGVAAIGTGLKNWKDIKKDSKIFNKLGKGFGKIKGGIVKGAKGIGGAFKSIGGLMKSGIMGAVKGLGGAFSSLFSIISANPMILVVIAIVALIAALIWAYQNVDWFREGVNNLFASFQPLIDILTTVGQALYDVFIGTITQLMDWIGSFTEQLGLDSGNWIEALLGFILFLPQLPFALAVAIANSIASVLGFGDNFVGNMINSAYEGVMGFANWISQLPGMVSDELNRVLSLIGDFISSIPSRVYEMGQAVVSALMKALGIGSPGHMYYMVEGEFDRIDNLTKKTNFDTSRIGADMVAGFNPNFETSNGNANSVAGSITNVFNIDSVDSEERVKQLAKEIGRLMRMDNVTAGRGV